jgi:hypothetical protein
MSFRYEQVLDCLPCQTVVATDILVGDVAFLHGRWYLVSAIIGQTDMRQSNNYEVDSVDGTHSYFESKDEVEVLRRDLLDRDKVDALVQKLAEEKAEYDRIQAEQEKEEKGW